MAEENQQTSEVQQSAKGGGGGSLLPALLIIVLMPVISFAMFKFAFIPMIKAEIPAAGAAPEIDPSSIHIEHEKDGQKYTSEFPDVVANIKGTSMTRYIQSTFTVYSLNPDFEAVVEAHRTPMKDVALNVLGNLTLADLEKREIKNIVRNQLKQGFDHVLPEPMVEDIFFSQFVVQ